MNDVDWVEDVKRWVLAGAESTRSADAARSESESWFIGYEAAHPALQAHHGPTPRSSANRVVDPGPLQARHWPDAPTTGR